MKKLSIIRNIIAIFVATIYVLVVVMVGNCNDYTTQNYIDAFGVNKNTDNNEEYDVPSYGDSQEDQWKAQIGDYSIIQDAMAVPVDIPKAEEKTPETIKPATTTTTEKKPATTTAASSSDNSFSGKIPQSGSGTTPPPSVSVPSAPSEGWSDNFNVYDCSTKTHLTISAYDAICSTVQYEMSGLQNLEALKAQALASYSYAKSGHTLTINTSQSIDSKVKQAVTDVNGLCVYYNGSPINAMYYSCNSGYSANCSDVYGGKVAYLTSVESVYDKNSPKYKYSVTYSQSEMKSLLEDYFNISLSSNPADWLKITSTLSAGMVGNIEIDGKKANCTGRVFREKITNYKVHSSAFTISYASGKFTITSYGYGHMVGMSQYGAYYYAKNDGWNYAQILAHYYQGTTIK